MLRPEDTQRLAASPGSRAQLLENLVHFLTRFDLFNCAWAGTAQKTVALLYLLLVTLFQRLVCGTNGLRGVVTKEGSKSVLVVEPVYTTRYELTSHPGLPPWL